jgi:hypothetical protein
METGTPKPTLMLLRVIFWTFWVGTIGLPILSLLGVSRRISEFTDYDMVFYPVAFVFLIMLCFTSASCVQSLPQLARFGMITVGFMLLVVLLLLLANPSWLVGTSS